MTMTMKMKMTTRTARRGKFSTASSVILLCAALLMTKSCGIFALSGDGTVELPGQADAWRQITINEGSGWEVSTDQPDHTTGQEEVTTEAEVSTDNGIDTTVPSAAETTASPSEPEQETTVKPNEDQPTTSPSVDQPTTSPSDDQPTTIPSEEQPNTSPSQEIPSTSSPSTEQPSTEQPSTEQPTTIPSEEQPNTSPSQEIPSTSSPSTEQPTTIPSGEQPNTSPSQENPSTSSPGTEQPTTIPSGEQPNTSPSQEKPTTSSPSTTSTTEEQPKTTEAEAAITTIAPTPPAPPVFECQTAGLFPHISGDCQRFYNCLQDPLTSQLLAFEMLCPPLTVFSPAYGRCVRDLATCKSDEFVCPNPGRFAGISDSYYYNCVVNLQGGYHKYIVRCSAGQRFEPLFGRCWRYDWTQVYPGQALEAGDLAAIKNEQKQFKAEEKLRKKAEKNKEKQIRKQQQLEEKLAKKAAKEQAKKAAKEQANANKPLSLESSESLEY